MFKIVEKRLLADNIYLLRIAAPRVAASALPGQFVIVRVDEQGERVPLTIADYDKADGTVTIVIQTIGASTRKLCTLNEGDAIADFAEAILLASFLTYLTLAAILESFWRPFLILCTLPYGLIGVLWALRLSGYGINIFVMLGVLMLIGVVVNAAVLIVDRFGQLRDGGASPHQAMVGGAGDSFRAVLMVILASALGMLPMALADGIGSELRVGIGTASFGGVIAAGILTMVALPMLYCMFTPKDKK